MKKAILVSLISIWYVCIKAQSPCYLSLGSLFLTYPTDSSVLAPKTVSLFNKEDILKSIFGNIYFNCDGGEYKVRSFRLRIEGENSQPVFERNYPYNYILSNDTILEILQVNEHFSIQLDSIKLYDDRKVGPILFKY